MSEENVTDDETLCYSYEVNVIVQVFGKSREEADDRLNRDGGYISKRTVVFKHSTPVYNEKE